MDEAQSCEGCLCLDNRHIHLTMIIMMIVIINDDNDNCGGDQAENDITMTKRAVKRNDDKYNDNDNNCKTFKTEMSSPTQSWNARRRAAGSFFLLITCRFTQVRNMTMPSQVV